MQGLTLEKVYGTAVDLDRLGLLTNQVHFDALELLVIKGPVRKVLGPEFGVHQFVHGVENVEVELGGHTFGVVIGGMQQNL